jgi:hypothetical protein
MSAKLSASSHPKNWHGLAHMGGEEPAQLYSITHQMTTNAMTFGPDLLMSAKLSASSHPKNWHGLAHMGHQEPAQLCSITHQTHMEDIQWSGGS